MYNKLLQRQIQKYFGSADLPENISTFLKSINSSYDHFEQDRLMLERSIEISSEEMIELNESQRKAHQDLKILFENIEEVFFSIGFMTNKLLHMSSTCEKVYGYPLGDFLVNSNLWLEVVIEEDKGILEKCFVELFQGKSTINEYRINRQDGSICWVQTKMSPTLDSSKNLIRVDGVTSDITNKKQAEFASSYNEKKFQNLFEKMLDGIYKSSPEGKFIEVNPALVKMLGYSDKAELLAIDIKADLYFETSERDDAIGKECKDGISTFRLKKKDGSEIWVEDRGQYIYDSQGTILHHEGILRDVTHRIKSEMELRSSQKETADYRLALDQSLIVTITNQKGEITYANENFCKISQYKLAELIGSDHRIINSGYHPKSFFQDLWRTISNGEVWRGEIKNKAKDGSYYWVESTIVPFLDENGRPYQYLAIRTDITEKKNSEMLIIESENKFRTIIQSSTDLIQSVNVEGKFEFVNDAWLRTMGYTQKELENITVFDIIDQSHINYCKENFRRVLNGESLNNLKTVFVTKQGKLVTLEGNSVPQYNDNIVIGGQTFFSDVTEREKVQQEIIIANDNLKIHIERLTEAQQIAKLGSWTMDIQSHTIVRSKEFYKIFESNKEEYPAEHNGFLKLIHPDDREKADRIITKAVNEKTPYQYEARLLMKDGRVKNIYSNGQFIQNALGEYFQMHGTVQDITEQKTIQLEMEKNIVELKKSNSELDKFVYSVSHDLRAPLSSMLGVIEISRDDTEDEIMLEHLAMLQKNILKLDGFITDILDYSRNSRTEITKEEINFNELLLDITQNLKFMGGTNRIIDIRIDVNDETIIKSDKSRICIILNNLVSNAIRYQNPNIDQPFVSIKVDMSDTETGIIIRDNGIGMRKEVHQKIFDMFYRVSDISVGSGLGLYIVNEAVQKLNGNIEVQSEIGEGSTFTIKLPNL